RRTQRANRVCLHQVGRYAKFRKVTAGTEVGAVGAQLHGRLRGIITSERQVLNEFIAHQRIDRVAARWMGESDRQGLALSRTAHPRTRRWHRSRCTLEQPVSKSLTAADTQYLCEYGGGQPEATDLAAQVLEHRIDLDSTHRNPVACRLRGDG